MKSESRAASTFDKLMDIALNSLSVYINEEFDVDKLKSHIYRSAANLECFVSREFEKFNSLSNISNFKEPVDKIGNYLDKMKQARKNPGLFLWKVFRTYSSRFCSLDRAKEEYIKAWEKFSCLREQDSKIMSARVAFVRATITLRMAMAPLKTLGETTDKQLKKVFSRAGDLYAFAKEISKSKNIFDYPGLLGTLQCDLKALGSKYIGLCKKSLEMDTESWQGQLQRIATGMLYSPSFFSLDVVCPLTKKLVIMLKAEDIQFIHEEVLSFKWETPDLPPRVISKAEYEHKASTNLRHFLSMMEYFGINHITTQWCFNFDEEYKKKFDLLFTRKEALKKEVEEYLG